MQTNWSLVMNLRATMAYSTCLHSKKVKVEVYSLVSGEEKHDGLGMSYDQKDCWEQS